MKKISLPGALVFLILLPVGAQATPILSAAYANNDQTFGAFDTVTIFMDITNSGDMDYSGTKTGSSIGLINWHPDFGGPYDIDTSTPASFPSTVVFLAGTTTTIAFFEMFSSAGAPVGNYTAHLTSLFLTGSISFSLGEFRWSVVGVPEPTTLALLGIGLFGMGLARRRKKA